ncbi:hypothetical protein ACFXDE_01935 [Kitasatospora sp. NPDC059408]|uniref:hypothetical protein n=1 Tax=Kitasatospora sp. NPDC059408 TaxID=3346823 RepID=UPI0036A9BF59
MTINGSALVVRAWEPPEEVILSRHIIESPGLQPEDIGVLARLLVRDPGQPSTILALARELHEAGWKMGESRFAAIFKRLKKAGHVQHVSEFNPATNRPQWVVRVYRNPANNDQYVQNGVEAASQVRAETVESSVSPAERPREAVETDVSRGQSETVETTDSGAKPWKSGIRKTTVSRGQSRNRGNHGFAVHPPHPPEEVDTSSPNPLTQPAAPAGEEAGFSPEQTVAAGRFLQELPAPWAVGRRTAVRLAPKLLEAIAEQGWDLDQALVAELTKNPNGINSHSRVLATRIDDLPLHAVVRPAPRTVAPPGRRAARTMCTCCGVQAAATTIHDGQPYCDACTTPCARCDTTVPTDQLHHSQCLTCLPITHRTAP